MSNTGSYFLKFLFAFVDCQCLITMSSLIQAFRLWGSVVKIRRTPGEQAIDVLMSEIP